MDGLLSILDVGRFVPWPFFLQGHNKKKVAKKGGKKRRHKEGVKKRGPFFKVAWAHRVFLKNNLKRFLGRPLLDNRPRDKQDKMAILLWS